MSPMDHRKLVPTQVPGILDFAPGAAAAYSLRNLSLSYSGPVVTVRRSTDSAEADFTAAEVSDGTLAAWCSGGDGFVKTWHDQSGDGNSVSQATSSDQPQVVDAGSLITEGGKAAIRFDGVDDYLNRGVTPSIATDIVAVFIVFKVTDASAQNILFRVNTTTQLQTYGFVSASGTLRWHARSSAASYIGTQTEITGSHSIASGLWLADDSLSLALNGALLDSASGATYPAEEVSVLSIGRNPSGTGFFLDGTISELIVYPSDQTALRTRIEGNINRQFGVF